jgi:hypothetical protein
MDLADRLAAWDETVEDLATIDDSAFDVVIDTDDTMPGAAAQLIHDRAGRWAGRLPT